MSKKNIDIITRESGWYKNPDNPTDQFKCPDARSCSIKKSSQRGLQQGWSRATFILKKEYIDKLKALSYWERTTIKEIIDDALSAYLKDKDANL